MHFASFILAFGAIATVLALPTADVNQPAGPANTADFEPHNFVDSKGEKRVVWVAKNFVSTEDNQGISKSRDLSGLEKRFRWYEGGNQDKCGGSTFFNRAGADSPTEGDCRCVADYARNTLRGYWTFNRSDGKWFNLVWCGNCVFGVGTANWFDTPIGNTDVADLTYDTINRFNWNGHVGGTGDMGCHNGIDMSRVEWNVYRT
ncbi:uncharacterized protein CTRU02_201475 [Colletotrichum truncatum]|uniref:Uncharacterized protein n=1 Tax=Colletotrichum truncatum TaxID=5467 RepID=A0ACC3ZI79_COLTU|nr:uncharacterized protein CTRU02_14347 [Colletotrichum truncatum]KAF6782308.1 hypothetical protein CTRU02_14347 [Colletotrichum truncatum]